MANGSEKFAIAQRIIWYLLIMSSTEGDRNRRRNPRFEVNLPNIICWNDERLACRLVDVSENGALLETNVGASFGDKVEMDLPTGSSIIGRIVRITGTHIALSFPGILLISPILEHAKSIAG